MTVCAACGNNYSKPLQIILGDKTYTFDCFECAIYKLAPSCAVCGCTIIGHGVESHDQIYCCAHCARQAGVTEVRDHA